MCELGHEVFEKHIKERLIEMQKAQIEADESKKVLLKEKYNRVTEWVAKFK